MADTDNKEKRPELVDEEPAKGDIEHANPELVPLAIVRSGRAIPSRAN